MVAINQNLLNFIYAYHKGSLMPMTTYIKRDSTNITFIPITKLKVILITVTGSAQSMVSVCLTSLSVGHSSPENISFQLFITL